MYRSALVICWRLTDRPYMEWMGRQGVGYGMLLALYSNDQAYFNTQLDNAEKYMWNGRCVV